MRIGNGVRICHEVGNPHDKWAIVAVSSGGKRIGYVPKDNWIQGLIHEEGRSCRASLAELRDVGDGVLAVILDVTIADGAAEKAYYRVLK